VSKENTTEWEYGASRRDGWREVLFMSWPIVLGSLSHTVLEFTDKLMVAQLGTEPVAALGSAGLWSFTLCTVTIGILGCVSTFVSQCLGRGERQHCASYTWQGMHLAVTAVVMALLLFPFTEYFFSLMNHEPEVFRLEVIYFKTRLWGYWPLAAMTALAAFFQSAKHPRIPMYCAMAGVALNIGLNYLLIYGNFGFPRWEIFGAGVATVIAGYFQCGLLLAVFLNGKFNRRYSTRTTWAFHSGRALELLRIGLPNGMNFFLDIALWGIFTSFVVGSFGSAQLAAHNIAISLIHVSFMPALAMNQAIAPIVGQWIGRKRIDIAKARTYIALKMAMGYMTVMALLLAIFGGTIIARLFSDDPSVILIGGRILIIAMFFQTFDAVNIVCMGALRGAGDTRWVLIVLTLLGYLFFLPLAWVLSVTLGGEVLGAWLAATIYLVVLSAIIFGRFHREAWRRISIFSDDAKASREK
jgi:multidrug resistance protein, MATE family